MAPDRTPEPTWDELPDAVRHRVVALTAEVLPSVTGLPAPLRRAADFAPARRARLGGPAIAEALQDPDLVARVGTQVAAARGGEPAGDDVAAAALAWLVRPEGWEQAVHDAVRRVAVAAAAPRDDSAAVQRLQDRLAAAEQAVRDARAKARTQIDELKADNTTLRRRLGEARASLRTAEADVAQHRAAAELAEKRLDAAETAHEKELRRLRSRIEELEGDLSARRRAGRAERDDVTLRTKLLLDALADAASGLRRELNLPAVTGAPADRVEAALADADPRAGTPGLVIGPSGSAMLEQLLSLPRARLVVDGYNVSKTAWPTATLEAQRTRLLAGLAPLAARTGADTIVVFDAASVVQRPSVVAPRGVKVAFSPPGVIADEVIGELVEAEPPGRVVVVVTGDQAVVRRARAAGARAAAAEALVALIATA